MSTSTSSRRRVVITGLGIISPIGIGVDAFWNSIAAQKSGVSKIERLSATAVPGNIAGEVKDFTEETAKKVYLKDQRKSIRIMCREIQVGAASANLAVANAGLDLPALDHDRLGIEFGANQMLSPPSTLQDPCFAAAPNGPFDFNEWGPHGLFTMEPLWLLKYLPNMPACHIGIHLDARGPNNSLTMAEASGNTTLGEALRIIERDRADIMLAGTCGVRIHAVKCLHAALWDKLADFPGEDPTTWSRPFDATRRGEVVGEGACSFILEEENFAKGRGAKILGSLLGAGSSCAISRDGTPNFEVAVVNAVTKALAQAGVSAKDIGHINAHGLSHPTIDIAEANAIRKIFGDDIPVTAPKSFLGNSGAACGTLELAASLLALNHGVVPATLNFKTPDPACPLNVVHGQMLPVANKLVVSINITNNGQAAAVVAAG